MERDLPDAVLPQRLDGRDAVRGAGRERGEQRVQTRVVGVQGHRGVGDAQQRGARLRRVRPQLGADRVQSGPGLPDVPGDQLVEQGLLVREVLVQRPDGDAGPRHRPGPVCPGGCGGTHRGVCVRPGAGPPARDPTATIGDSLSIVGVWRGGREVSGRAGAGPATGSW
ncbi:hypothetical protein GCM10025792_39550 [Pseudonocardia tropica]